MYLFKPVFVAILSITFVGAVAVPATSPRDIISSLQVRACGGVCRSVNQCSTGCVCEPISNTIGTCVQA
ncbi:hypothetical protein M422DRAFT_31815 [Sphaerobolus stellatus SS14]|uniref:Extracellular membrane protein CFEM domain-containing protein n=1 Tax=Sphaerobolus stellatus (strain SS14) TaxID=990650 RepID=A0A0C9V2E2_SPHS4|nr:hypothetical protein M422DRAFT_31815 [Sphaerobolus stellatus SS14]